MIELNLRRDLNLIDDEKNSITQREADRARVAAITHDFPTSVTFRPPKRVISIQSNQLSISPKRRSELNVDRLKKPILRFLDFFFPSPGPRVNA